MLLDQKETFFADHAISIQPSEDCIQPFTNHAKLPLLTDILSRKYKHHILLKTNFDNFSNKIFLEALLKHYRHQRGKESTQMLLLNLDNIHISDIKQINLEKEFAQFRAQLAAKNETLLLAITSLNIFSKETKKSDERFLRRELDALMNHPNCRLVLLLNQKQEADYAHLNETFVSVEIKDVTAAENFNLLKHQCIDLETYHQVVIPDELLTLALTLSKRFLHSAHPLEKTLLLLDSAAARLQQAPHTSLIENIKPVLTDKTLLEVLSDWTHIPSAHLQPNYFRMSHFNQHLQQSLFGQDIASHLLGEAILEAHTPIKASFGPFAKLLFIGKEHSGKETAAYLLSDYLFKNDFVYIVSAETSHESFLQTKAKHQYDKKTYRVIDLIQDVPYAIIYFEHAEKLEQDTLSSLQEIMNTGLFVENGTQYDFSQATIILATNIEKACLEEFVETYTQDQDIYTMDLMQLVMSDQKQQPHQPVVTPSADDVLEKVMPEIAHRFPHALTQQLKLIPFLPLQKNAFEKIIRHKLKMLGKQLESEHQIELGYAPEVIRYLTTDALDHDNLERSLSQLHTCLEQALLNLTDNANASNQLFLQLNETGHSLRHDWLEAVAREHAF